ncbi:TonB-dependent receptor [Adhaeribacter aerolatus]|nr:TonB-dependent receptor [Adhaeribacter aerolatus]
MKKNLYYLFPRIAGSTLLSMLFQLIIISAVSAADAGERLQGLKETKITLSLRNASLQDFIRKIEAATVYKFAFDEQETPHKVQISISAKNESLEKVLARVAADTQLEFKQVNNNIHVRLRPLTNPEANFLRSSSVAAVDITVSGKIVSRSGEGLPGVTILLKGTNNGATSGPDGSYTLVVPNSGGTLIFSFIGFATKEVPVPTSGGTLNITLEDDAKALEEVVVVGYGTQKKVNVTGAISMVKGEDLKQAPTTHVTNTLTGRVAGVIAVDRSGEPGGGGSQLFIRGQSTLGDNSPLIVVDGIPSLLGGLDKLNPNDIESISVLKDASASIYGSRAANGVILVKTKRGKTGKPTLDYNFNQGFVTPTRMPEMADAGLYAQLTNEILGYAGTRPKYTDEDIQKFKDGSSPWTHPNTDWIDAVIKPWSLQNRHNLSLRGGGDKVRYFVSLGSVYEDAVYRNSATNYKQQNLRINLDADVTENIKLNFDVQGRHSNKNYPPLGSSDIFRFIQRGRPTETAVWPNGLPGPDIEQGNNPVVTSTNTIGYNKHDINLVNALFGYTIKLPWVKGLFIDGNLAASKELTYKKNFIKPWTLYTFGGFNGQNEPILNSAERGVSDPQLTESFVHSQQITLNSKINYARTFGPHSISAFVAYEQNEEKGNDFYGSRRYFISAAVDQLFAGGQDERQVSGSGYEAARKNYFGRASYQFRDTYLFDFNWRYDGSQNFPRDKRFGFFPGFSAGWVVSNENFWKNNINLVDFFKVRGSWGQMGNDKVANFQYLSNYGFGSGSIFGNDLGLNPSIYPIRIPNENITWEVANNFNVGIESQLFNGSVSLEVDYFRTKRSNILIARSASVPEYTGIVLPDENLGKVQNQGFDAQLSHRKSFGKFRMETAGTVSFARNKILFWDEPENIPDYQRYTGTRIGSSLYYEAMGIYKDVDHVNSTPHMAGARPGDVIFRDVNEDGKINALDRTRFNKSQFPEWTYGLNMNFVFGDLDLSMLWQGAAGANQYVRTESGLIGNFPLAYVENRWTPENTDTDVARVFDNREYWITQQNSYWLYNTNYLRLKTLQLGYNIPETLVQKLKMQQLRVYVSGQNLLTFDKVKIFDPELPNGAGHYYPQIKIYNAGLSLTF